MISVDGCACISRPRSVPEQCRRSVLHLFHACVVLIAAAFNHYIETRARPGFGGYMSSSISGFSWKTIDNGVLTTST